jgi:hypothetical protein
MPADPDMTTPQPCLMTTVRNISGVQQFFGFLPPHGRTLGAGEQYSTPGDLATFLACKSGGGSVKKYEALERALANALLALVSTPAVHLYDPIRAETEVLELSDGNFEPATPCWGAYVSM